MAWAASTGAWFFLNLYGVFQRRAFVNDCSLLLIIWARSQLDLTKLPLGKISRKQIERAYTLLGQVDALLRDADQVRQAQLIDVSNQFYTLIPHDFGRKKPPLLDSLDLVKVGRPLDENDNSS